MPEGQAESLPEETGADMLAGVSGEVTSVKAAESIPVNDSPVPVEKAPETSQAFDEAAFREQVGALGDGYTPETILQKHQDAIKGMNTAQRERADLARKYEGFDPVISKMQEDAGYAEALQRTTEEYFNKDSYQGATDVPQEVVSALDTTQQRLAQMEVKFADQEIEKGINACKSDGMPIDQAAEAAIWKRVEETGSMDVKSHAWAILGKSMVEAAAKSGVQTTVDKIQKNNQSYVEAPTLPSVETKEVKPEDLSDSERGDMMLSELSQMMPGGE